MESGVLREENKLALLFSIVPFSFVSFCIPFGFERLKFSVYSEIKIFISAFRMESNGNPTRDE